MPSEARTVDRAAIRADDGVVWTVPRPGRHIDVMRLMVDQGYAQPISGERGFLLSDQTFCSRTVARVIAHGAGQLLPKAGNYPQLFSEDVW